MINLPNQHKKILLTSGFVLVILVSVMVGAIVGVTYPNWSSNLSFLPSFMKVKSAGLTETEKTTTIRTVEESAVIDAVKKASPAVVSIVAQTAPLSSIGSSQNQQGIGTGFIVKSNGVILTNSHVVEDSTISYKVVTKDEKTYAVKKIDQDPSIDFAILKIDVSNLPTVDLGDSDATLVGQKVIAIGNALGMLQNTVTVGVVSGIGRGVTASSSLGVSQETLENVIQTDAALNPGNSGGPLLDLSAKVIGINFATTQGAENIGFVIPINRIKSVLDQYLAVGRIVRPYLGISSQTVDQASASLYGIPQGAFVQQVVSGSPADKAGLQEGDVITKFGGTALKDGTTVISVIGKFKVGQTVGLEVWRDGKTINLKATLVEAPH
jgi:S1-C subfamily serine protease